MSEDTLKAIATEEIHEMADAVDLLDLMETYSLDEYDAGRVMKLVHTARITVEWSE